MGRVRSKSTFEALRSARLVGTSGPIRIRYVDGLDRPCVAFAISRKVGNAVVRNRLRRRLRAISQECSPVLHGGSYLIGVSPCAVDLSYGELKADVETALTTINKRMMP